MRIDQMREFLAVAQAGSITAASEKIYVAQPVLSKHLRAIEDELSGRLFTRTSRGVKLTPLGAKARKSFETIIASYDDLIEAAARESMLVHGTLRIGMLNSGFNHYVAPTVFELKSKYPSIEVQSATQKPAEIIADLRRGKLDVGFHVLAGEAPKSEEELEYLTLARESVLIAIPSSSPASVKSSLSPFDLSPTPLICLKWQDTTSVMNKLLYDAGIRSSRVIEVDEVELAPYFIERTGGFFAISEFMLDQFEAYPNIKILPMDTPMYSYVTFVYRRANENPALPIFLDLVRERIANA